MGYDPREVWREAADDQAYFKEHDLPFACDPHNAKDGGEASSGSGFGDDEEKDDQPVTPKARPKANR
jgi:capsid protein